MKELLLKSIKWGCFKTEHHRKTADEQFKCALAEYICKNIVPLLTIAPDKVNAELKTNYDDPKFFGPNSICKYRYSIELVFREGTLKETANLTFSFDPISCEIRPLYNGPHIKTLESERKFEEYRKMINNIVDSIKQGATELGSLCIVETSNGPRTRWINCEKKDCLQIYFRIRY